MIAKPEAMMARNPASPGETAPNYRAFELYFKALTNTDVAIETYHYSQDIHFPDTRTTLRIPRGLPGIADRDLCRIALAHRSLYRSLGTFEFSFRRLQKILPVDVAIAKSSNDGLLGFFLTFSDVQLAKRLFEAVEGFRIDSQLPVVYPGLQEVLSKILICERLARPHLEVLTRRTAAIELVLRLSLQERFVEIPERLSEILGAIAGAFDGLSAPSAKVEDCALATIRLYGIVSKLPSLGTIGPGPVVSTERALRNRSGFTAWPESWPESARERIEGDDIMNLTLPGVGFRGSLESFFGDAPSASGPDHQAVYIFNASDEADSLPDSATIRAERSGPPEPLPHDHHDVSRELHHQEHGELGRRGANTILYPEWDMYAGRYLRDWCRVIVSRPGGADPTQRSSLAFRYSKELRRLRKTMEFPPHQAFVAERKTTSGPDIDFDAAVEAIAEFRQSGDMSDAIYLDVKRKRRDLAVTVLIDVSASTAQRVEGAVSTRLALSGIKDYDATLRPPRILDIEVVSALLCTSALHNIGDAFSIWAFSGTGRESVLLSEIKAFSEPFSGMVVARAAALKPLHATRMGAAVRHCSSELFRAQAQTKVLMVLTDGRPFDIDYGTSYGEHESVSYALSDTNAAFGEAKEVGISPYVLSVDPDADKYLSSLDNVTIEALTDVERLPEAVLSIYLGLMNRDDRYRKRPGDQIRKRHIHSRLEGLPSL